MDTYWLPITEFPNYSVSNHGDVKNNRFNKLLKPSKTKHGVLKVNLLFEGKYHTRSVKVLVAEAFVPRPGYYSSSISPDMLVPLLLDGNQENLDSSNLVWRSRSFCVRYKQACIYEKAGPYLKLFEIVDMATGRTYNNPYEAAIIHGLIPSDVSVGAANEEQVYPTRQTFTTKLNWDRRNKVK